MTTITTALPLHNEIIANASQNSDDEILIETLQNGKLKVYFLKATAEDVFEAAYGETPGFDFKSSLDTDHYIMYAETNRGDWTPEEDENVRFEKRTAERIAEGRPLEVIDNKNYKEEK